MAKKRRNSLAYPMTYDLKQGHRNPHCKIIINIMENKKSLKQLKLYQNEASIFFLQFYDLSKNYSSFLIFI